MSESKGSGVNVEVVVRCRPLNSQERSEGTPAVVSVTSQQEVCIRQTVGKKRMDKKYHFDRAFGQYATQKEVFSTVVSPIIDEVLEGFNCTVFAYGQTGTGKTHTMEGTMDDPDNAGIIPRAVQAVFQHLESAGAEYSVRLSFLELYNEQLEDLLAKDDSTARLRIVEDARRGVLCNGLEEVLVHNLPEVQKAITLAINKRKVAETLLNKASSRSHCIFTLTIHKKETTPDGEDLLKVGKLNLVDLAGSECVGRSGAKNKRAREAGNINQSLLTLGRVITALVEHRGHIPYRDSKLTRLLQESLGGRARTCIIATLSPSIICVDETMSTLDYAHRAKNIKNKPEVNQKMTKRVLLREYSSTIERLKEELQATREKNGVYLPIEQYQKMEMNLQGQSSQLTELEAVLETRQKELKDIQAMFNITKEELDAARAEAASRLAELKATQATLTETKVELEETQDVLGETEFVLEGHATKESQLRTEAVHLQHTLGVSKTDVGGLWAKIGRKSAVEAQNQTAVSRLQGAMGSSFASLTDHAAAFHAQSAQRTSASLQQLQAFLESQNEEYTKLFGCVDDLSGVCSTFVTQHGSALDDSREQATQQWAAASEASAQHAATAQARSTDGQAALVEALAGVRQRLQQSQDQVAALVAHVADVQRQAVDHAAAFAAAHQAKLVELRDAVAGELATAKQGTRQQRAAMDEFRATQEVQAESDAATFMASMQSLMATFVESQKARTADGIAAFQVGLDTTASVLDGVEATATQHGDALARDVASWRDAAGTAADEAAAKLAEEKQVIDAAVADVSAAVQATQDSAAAHQAALSSDIQAWQADVASAATAAGGALQTAFTAVQDRVAAFGSEHGVAVEAIQEMTAVAHNGSKQFGAAAVQANEDGAAAVEAQAAFVEAWTQEARGHVEDFTDSRFQQDQPTGETPLKKEYPAPEHLVTPPNRAKLAARYRVSKLSHMAGPPGTPVQRTAEVDAVGDAPSPVTRLDAAMGTAAMEGDAAEAAPAVAEDDVVLTVDTEAAAVAADAASTAPPSTRSGRSTPSAASVTDDGDDADGDDASADASGDGASSGAAPRAGRSRIPTAGGASRTRGRSTRRKKAAADESVHAKSRSRSRHARSATSSEDAPVAKAKPATRRSSRRRATGKALGDATNVA